MVKNKETFHDWNVITVSKFSYPRPSPIEFQIKAKNLLGASMKANNKLKKSDSLTGQKILKIYWLDPKWKEKND